MSSLCSSVNAQVSLTALGSAQTQSFDTLAATGTTNAWADNATIAGWYATQTVGTLSAYRAGDGSTNNGALYSFGTAAAAERALGSAASGTPGNFFYAGRYVNNTGAPITSLLVAYTGEQWRNGGNATAQRLDFSYQVANAGAITGANAPNAGWTDVDALDFTSPIASATAIALDGNAAANQAALSNTITLNVAPGQEVWIRWLDINDSGNDHGLGIDNVSVTPQGAAVASADLSLTKVDVADPVTAGSNLTHTITLTNAGPDAATAAAFTDTLPADTSFVSLTSPGGWSCTTPAVGAGAGGTIDCSTASQAVGSAVFTLTTMVAPGVAAASVISNSATATSTTADPTTGNESATATTTVAVSADVSISNVATPDPVSAGSNLTYTITASNAGPSNAAAVNVSDVLAAGSTFVSLTSPGGWTCTTPAVGANGTVTCDIASMAVGNAAFTLVANVPAAATGGSVVSNTATVTTTSTDPNPGNQSATATSTVSAPATISGSKSVIGTFAPGGAVTYTITLNNISANTQGDNPGDEFVDALPAGLSLVSATASSGTAVANIGTHTVTWNGSIAAAGSVSITINASIDLNVSGGTTISNQGTINFDADGNGSNEASTVTDDPATGAAGDGTAIVIAAVGEAVAIPASNPWTQLLLMMALAMVATITLRRRMM